MMNEKECTNMLYVRTTDGNAGSEAMAGGGVENRHELMHY